MAIKEGYYVKVEYTGTLEDGSLFDSSEEAGAPLEFQIGAQQVIDGFEKAIVDMELNQEKEITLQPKDAYGEHQKEMVREIPREQLPPEDLEVGTTLMATTPMGQMPVTITEMSDKTATIDFNHPLAGKVLNFKLKVIEIKEGELCKGDCCSGCSCG